VTKLNRIRASLFWMLPAFCFLFNPNIAVIDLLPDFVGYIFLSVALAKLGDLNDALGEARKAFLRMILIDVAKLLAILWIFGMEAAGERSSSFLLWSFVFAVLEWIFLIPAYQKLFDGVLQLGNFYENTSIFKKPQRARTDKSMTERLRGFTVVFVAIKALLSFLPELADLTNMAYNEQGSVLNLYQYIGTMRMLCFIPVLIVGLVWLVRMLRYVISLRRDAVLMKGLDASYEEKVVPNQGMFIGRSVTMAYTALLMGAILTLDLRLDHINLLPDILAFLGLLIFFLFLKKQTPLQKGFWTISLTLYGILCVASMIGQGMFFSRYTYGALMRNDKALLAYVILVAVEIGKSVSFLLVGLCIARSLRAVIVTHTGYVMGQHAHAEVIARHVEGVQKELKKYVTYMLVTMAVYAVADVAYEILNPNYGVMGTINLIFGLIWIVTVWKAQSEIGYAVKTKYMLE